jgi:DNA-binding transcriptional regulator YiaG
MDKQYRDEIAMVCHDMMKDAHSVGGVSDAEMREFEADCLVEKPEADIHTAEKLPA